MQLVGFWLGYMSEFNLGLFQGPSLGSVSGVLGNIIPKLAQLRLRGKFSQIWLLVESRLNPDL